MKYALFVLAGLWLAGCEIKVDAKGKGAALSSSSSKIRNNIELHENGLQVSQAFLVYEDGTLVPETNLTKVNQSLHIRLVIESGWTVQNGLVQIGASEKIETSDGDVILNEPDLFANTGDVTAEDSKLITLKVVITRVTKLYDYYRVSFRVWDKVSNHEVSGSYKFNVQ